MRLAPLPLFVLLAGACTGEVYERNDPVYGSATIAWSISGSTDPAACPTHGVSSVRVVVEHDDGTLVSDDRIACRASSARYVLRHGSYEATLTLLDASGVALAEPRRSGTIFVAAGRDTFVMVDIIVPSTSGDEAE